MRRLVILRHAKAVPHGAAPDFDRALSDRGKADAVAAGRYLAGEHILPDLALVSPSLRTRETWEEASRALTDTPVRFETGIYDASLATLLALVVRTKPAVRTLALVGHNPGSADLAVALVGHGDRYALARMRASFPTAALVVLDFDVEDWSAVAVGGARLDRFVTPEHDEG